MVSDSSVLAHAPDQELFVPPPGLDNGLKVLVVDDDALFSRALCRLLVRRGYTAVLALRPARILPLVRALRFDAVLLDMRLGRADGLAVCRGLRRHEATKSLPVLMMTGFPCVDARQTMAARLSGNKVLRKPFSGDELEEALKRSLAARAPRAKAATGRRILIVDDDPSWSKALTHWLAGEGHETLIVSDPAKLLEQAQRFRPDCVVLNFLINGRPTEALCARLRESPGLGQAPIIVHSGNPGAKVAMLDAGADHFVVKSGAPAELLAVVRACLRRARPSAESASDGGVLLDFATRSLCCKGKAAVLSPRLFALARILIDARRTLSRQQILDRLPDAADERDHEVDVLVSRLRAVLRRHFGAAPSIETVYDQGYLWVPPSRPARP